MRKLVGIALVLVASYMAFNHARLPDIQAATSAIATPASLGAAQDQTEISGAGQVSRILPDDNHGSRHQRFILRLPSGQTVLIAHNIDLAPRVAPLAPGDSVEFKGEYAWNEKGGTVHWTHRDPAGRHPAGWLRRAGSTFQ